MFSKGDQDGAGDNSPKAPPLSNAISTPSIISSGLTITGDLIGAGDIQIDGNVTGDVKARALTLSRTSQVEGSVSATDVRLDGCFKGQVSADNVVLSNGAKVSGDITQNTMTIEAGADFEGSVRRLAAGKTSGGAGVEPQKSV